MQSLKVTIQPLESEPPWGRLRLDMGLDLLALLGGEVGLHAFADGGGAFASGDGQHPLGHHLLLNPLHIDHQCFMAKFIFIRVLVLNILDSN